MASITSPLTVGLRRNARPLALDLYSCAGGAAMGLYRAGYTPVCVDMEPQPNNPFEFYCEDALEVLAALVRGDVWHGYVLSDFATIHASPPCQGDSVMSKAWNGKAEEWPKLIPPTRDLLVKTGLPYTIENVVGADLIAPIKLCGSMFGLAVERHRLIESNVPLTAPRCDHKGQAMTWPDGFPALRSGRGKPARVVGVYGTGGGEAKDIERWKWAMGIGWMRTKHELAECLPPAYMEHIGRQVQESNAKGPLLGGPSGPTVSGA